MPAYTDELAGVFVTPPIGLPQLVPSRTCLQCDVCCRFPDPDSTLRPYFNEHEIVQALSGGVEARAFPNREMQNIMNRQHSCLHAYR